MAEEWDGKDRRVAESLSELIPRPDPSSLTTSALHREIGRIQNLLEGQIHAAVQVVNTELRHLRSQADERDIRYAQRHEASQEAIRVAVDTVNREVATAFAGSEKAILKAEVGIEKRADATYVAVVDQNKLLGGLVPRAEAEAKLKAIDDKLTVMAGRLDRQEGASHGIEKGWGFIVGAIGIAAAIITIILAFNS